jgi:hypothetical protein
MLWGTTALRVRLHPWGWGDPIGAAYSQWQAMTNEQRVQLMLETVIDSACRASPAMTVPAASAPAR